MPIREADYSTATKTDERFDQLETRLVALEKRMATPESSGYIDRDCGLSESNRSPGPWWWRLWRGSAELGVDLSLLPRLFTDPRYRLPWHFRVGVPVLVFSFFFSGYLMPLGLASLPLVGKVLDLFLAALLYWLVWREVCRYRRMSTDLPASWRTR